MTILTFEMQMYHTNGLYESYKKDPKSVDASWRLFFKGLSLLSNIEVEPNTKDSKETAVKNLIHAYRSRGHLKSILTLYGTEEIIT